MQLCHIKARVYPNVSALSDHQSVGHHPVDKLLCGSGQFVPKRSIFGVGQQSLIEVLLHIVQRHAMSLPALNHVL